MVIELRRRDKMLPRTRLQAPFRPVVPAQPRPLKQPQWAAAVAASAGRCAVVPACGVVLRGRGGFRSQRFAVARRRIAAGVCNRGGGVIPPVAAASLAPIPQQQTENLLNVHCCQPRQPTLGTLMDALMNVLFLE
jgi:hypothetical protein